MNNFTYQLYRIIIPKYFRKRIQAKRMTSSIFHYYKNNPEAVTSEVEEVVNYLKSNPITVFPYAFQDHYHAEDIEVFDDDKTGLRYVLLDEKRLYFKKKWRKDKIKRAYNNLLKEQDTQSPHRYINDQFQFDEGNVLIDAGAAEGNFALSVVEKASKVILLESDMEWLEPLQATFAPWKDKVMIVNKFVGEIANSSQTSLDDIIVPNQAGIFLKADVEGGELKLLKGATKLLSKQKPLKIAICTYHKANDKKELSDFLSKYNFDISFSKGFMISIYDKTMKKPYLRCGLLQAKKVE